MKTILVATDFSINANNACQYALEMAKFLKAEVILLHVFETPLMMAGQLFSIYSEEAEKKLNQYYDGFIKKAGKVKVSMTLHHGLPSSRIVELAQEKKADLIVIGTTGNNPVERIFFGTNALRVFYHSPSLVLAVPAGKKFHEFNKIAYATDLRTENITNSKMMLPFASKFNAEIIFLNISDALDKKEFDKHLQEFTQQIREHIKYPKMSGFLCKNLDVSEGINYFLKKHSVDILALYTRQRTLLKQIFLESVTKRMALHAITPLLIIPENEFTITKVKQKKQNKKKSA